MGMTILNGIFLCISQIQRELRKKDLTEGEYERALLLDLTGSFQGANGRQYTCFSILGHSKVPKCSV